MCGVHERSREEVARALLDGTGEAQHVARGPAVEHAHAMHVRTSDGERPRLVEHRDRGRAELLERASVPDDDLPPRGAVDAADDRDGRGEDERARRRDDEHGQRATRIA